MKYYSTIKRNVTTEIAITWMNLKLCKMTETKHKNSHTVWFHLSYSQKKAKVSWSISASKEPSTLENNECLVGRWRGNHCTEGGQQGHRSQSQKEPGGANTPAGWKQRRKVYSHLISRIKWGVYLWRKVHFFKGTFLQGTFEEKGQVGKSALTDVKMH